MDYGFILRKSLMSAMKRILRLIQIAPNSNEFCLWITFLNNENVILTPINGSILNFNEDVVTVILQHRFMDLKTEACKFSVTIEINETMVRVSIPFENVLAFSDPMNFLHIDFSSLSTEEKDKDIIYVQIPNPSFEDGE